jgi:hypothetical protein
MTIKHNFKLGDLVSFKGNLGEVISRGASKDRQFVQILFINGSKTDVVNEDIKKIRPA